MPNVLITGADRGLGLSLCKEYLSRGWTVFAGKYMEDYKFLDELACKTQSSDSDAQLYIIKLDMGSEASIAAAYTEVMKVADSLDMYISNAALMGDANCELYKPPMDLEAVWRSFRVNALGPVLLLEALLPLLTRGKMKRLCFVSSEVAGITLMKHRGDSPYPYPMSKASLNMAVKLAHNHLHENGYTFRLFHPGWMKFREIDGSLTEHGRFDPDYIGDIAARYFEESLLDEHRLVMVDYNGYEWPF